MVTVEIANTVNSVTIDETTTTVTIAAVLGNVNASVTQSASNPSAAPASVGLFWQNTTTGQVYFSLGTSATTDWWELPAMQFGG